jgi:hypothetical protein
MVRDNLIAAQHDDVFGGGRTSTIRPAARASMLSRL